MRPAFPNEAEIEARVNALYNPMRNDVLRAMQEASRQSQARLAAIGGLGGAWSGLLRQIAPRASEGYFGAATVAPQFGAAGGAAAAGRVGAGMAENAALAQQFAPAAPGEAPVNAGALGGVLTGLGGTIPGQEFQGLGEGAKKGAEAQVKAADAETSYDITMETLKAAQVDQQYVSQLIELAEKRPELYFQVVDEIRRVAREEDALAMEREKFNFDRTQANRDWRLALADDKRQDRALGLQERELGYDRVDAARDYKIDTQRVAIAQGNLRVASVRAATAVQQAEARGRQIDAAASKVRGFVVDKQGRFILDGGKRIKVATESKNNAAKNRTNAVSKARTSAFNFGRSLAKEVARKTPDLHVGGKAYVKRQGRNGQIFETTDDPMQALKTITFAEALERAWGAIDGDTLVSVYGLSPSQVRKQIRQALIRAGWRPDGKRP